MSGTPNILSLDGGGIRGISSLQILESIMQQTREAHNLAEVPRPCDVFDIIGGTSTGGIIAIMLGRLGMSVEDCLKAYRVLGERAFTPKLRLPLPGPPKGTYSSKALKAAIQQVIMDACRDSRCSRTNSCSHADGIFQDISCTKTIVLAATKKDVSAKPTVFKTYNMSSEFQDCTIWELALATSAATTFFKSVSIGRDGIEFVDAALGFNNPSEVIIQEAERLFPEAREMRILSIGTGLGGVVSIRDTRYSILSMLKKIGTESNKVADRLEERYQGTNQYFRFDVDRGMEDITLADWMMNSDISTYTHNYLKRKKAEISRFVSTLTISSGFERALPEEKVAPEAEGDNSRKEGNALTPSGLSIVDNRSIANSEQSNSIAKIPAGWNASLAGNMARDGSKQWNSITA